MQAAQARLVSKGQFAEILGVTAGRVSQLIAQRKLHGEALVGEGRSAQINVDVAEEQLGQSLDFVQRQAQALAKPASPTATITPEQQRIAAVRAETAEIELRKLRREEQEQHGILVDAAAARRAWGRELSELVAAIEQWFPEVALDFERLHGIEHKTAATLLRQAFRGFREKRADLARNAAFGQPQMIEEGGDAGHGTDQPGSDGIGGAGGGA